MRERPRLTALTRTDGKDLPQNMMAPGEFREWAQARIREVFGVGIIEHQPEEQAEAAGARICAVRRAALTATL
jgi:hypothetical protein